MRTSTQTNRPFLANLVSGATHPRQIERKAAMSEFVTAPHFVSCPDRGCGCIAEVTDRFDLRSTDGLISHVETYCVRRHVFRLPAYRVIPA